MVAAVDIVTEHIIDSRARGRVSVERSDPARAVKFRRSVNYVVIVGADVGPGDEMTKSVTQGKRGKLESEHARTCTSLSIHFSAPVHLSIRRGRFVASLFSSIFMQHIWIPCSATIPRRSSIHSSTNSLVGLVFYELFVRGPAALVTGAPTAAPPLSSRATRRQRHIQRSAVASATGFANDSGGWDINYWPHKRRRPFGNATRRR